MTTEEGCHASREGERQGPGEVSAPQRRLLAELCLAFLVALASLLGAGHAVAQEAQTGVVAGTVVAQGSLRPILDAQVRVAGTALSDLTDVNGKFRITGLASTEAALEVRRLGYQQASQVVRVSSTDVRIELVEKPVELNATVVTGTPRATEKRAVGNAVSNINAPEITETAHINSLQELLTARTPGVVIMPAGGGVGTGSRIRVRGVSSLSLSSQPLIYVDGVRINSAFATGPVNQNFRSSTISRLNDINPEDVESIEIIRGPAATTLYGTEANNGVIQIITERGVSGSASWNLMVKQGATYFQNPEERIPVNYTKDAAGNVLTIDIVEREKALGHPIWRTGHLQEYDLSVSGGAELVKFFVAGGLEDTEGIDPNNGVLRRNVRANVSVLPNSVTSLLVSLGYISGRTSLASEAGGGRMFSAILANPLNLTPPNASQRGFHTGTPEQFDLLSQFWQDLDRFTGSLQLSHQPLAWLSHRLNVGSDRTREGDVSFTPRVDSLIEHPFWGISGAPLGRKSVTARSINLNTVDYAASATFDVMPTLRSTTSLGGQFYQTETAFVFASGEVFPAPGVTAVSATTTNRLNAEDLVEETSLGFFVQEHLGWRDRLFLTVAIRSDDHSAFGQNLNRVYYPKASASWVVSEEPFWRFPVVDAIRLRAAYGESGQQPATFAALPTFQPTSGPADSGAVTPQFIGNPDLGAERGQEVELGFDAGLLRDRIGLEFTYYHKKTRGAILDKQIAPSVGFPGFQPFNAGSIRNSGVELLVRARPYQRGAVAWDAAFTLATNENKLLNLGAPACDDPLVPNAPAGCLSFVPAGTFQRHQVGFPVGAWFEQKIVSAQLDPAGRPINVTCQDGRGETMPCGGTDGVYGNSDDAPDLYIGRATPRVEGAFRSSVMLADRLRFYALFDFKRGHRKIDGNARIRCAFFGGRCRENFFPHEFDPRVIAEINSGLNLVGWLLEDASFTKFREFSVSYTVPDVWAAALRATRATVTVSGRNLYTWTSYGRRGGLDPEAMFLAGDRGGHTVWEQATTPQLTQWVAMLNLRF